jgi:hypothetical protein
MMRVCANLEQPTPGSSITLLLTAAEETSPDDTRGTSLDADEARRQDCIIDYRIYMTISDLNYRVFNYIYLS